MKLETTMRQGILVVRMDGEMDMHSAKEFRQVVDEALDKSGAGKMLLDFKNVGFIDSSGVGVVLGRYKRLNVAGGEVMAVNLSPQIKNIFQMSGILKLIKVFDCEDDAFC